MKLKYAQIIATEKILEILGKRTDFDGVTSLRLTRNIKNIGSHLINYKITENNLIIKYGKETEEENENGGKKIKVTPENKDQYYKEINNVLQEEVEIEIVLLDPSKISGFSPFELFPIEWMFENL